MKFEIDKQTIRDLEIFPETKVDESIFRLYNNTITDGGKDYLNALFRSPSTDIEQLRNRTRTIEYFQDIENQLEFNARQFRFIDHYLRLLRIPLAPNIMDAVFNKISYVLKPNNDYYLIKSGVQNLLTLLIFLKPKIEILIKNNPPENLKENLVYVGNFLNRPEYRKFFTEGKKISFYSVNLLDNRFRKKNSEQIKKIVKILFSFDAYISLAKTAQKNNLSIPKYINHSSPKLMINDLFHPLVRNAIPYKVESEDTANLCFLTGPNMAGKSTFLKAVGLSVYLAHLGFPVPASKMKLTIFNGIITTINLADNRTKGYSHFYSEVQRVKETALILKEKGKIFVIFDELFRGTNVKDAYDASLFVIKSFAKIKSSFFFISTHITEIEKELKRTKNIDYKYLDSKLTDDKPIFSYKLLDGVSHIRLGMQIVKNENIDKILDSIIDD